MRKQRFFSIFIVFVTLSLLLFVLSKSRAFPMVQGIGEQVLLPVQRLAYSILGRHIGTPQKNESLSLQVENERLIQQLVDQKKLERENKALQDQFATTPLISQTLLPATIIGLHSGVNQPVTIVIDKGKQEGVKDHSVVVYKDMYVGKVTRASEHLSVVALLTNPTTSLTARTTQTNALGIVTAKDESVLLDNVLLSEKLQKGDVVLTKGDVTKDGLSAPPDLMLGKIIAVHKKPSALFQTADVQPILDITRLSVVFVIVK